MSNSGKCLATFVADYEYNMGVEYAEFPSNNYRNNARTNVMYYAISEDGIHFTALNKNKAVLSPTIPNPTHGIKPLYQFSSPSVFRKQDGSYGALAANANQTSEILLYDSKDLLFFENQRVLVLNQEHIAIINPVIQYNGKENCYEIFWEGGDGKSYVSKSNDLLTVSATRESHYSKMPVKGEFPVYAKKEEISIFPLTNEEYARILRKYGTLKSVSISCPQKVEGEAGNPLYLPENATVHYNDGSTKRFGLNWDISNIDLLNPEAGIYKITGKVNQPRYNEPLAKFRADPQVVYIKKDACYYFTSSYMQEDQKNPYKYVILRKSDTINGITNAEEKIIWSETSEGEAKPWYWAPELHYFNGRYHILFLSTHEGKNWRMTVITCDGDKDPMEANNWKLKGFVNPDKNGRYPGAFDTTFFEYKGRDYYVSPRDCGIWISEFDVKDPLNLTGNLIRIAVADQAWEYTDGPAGAPSHHQYIEEASYVFFHDNRIFITYACATVDSHYGIGLLWADQNADFLNPESWHKYPQPLLITSDISITKRSPVFAEDGTLLVAGIYEGSFGPGHNSITIDENGNEVVIYHARVWGEEYAKEGEKYGLVDPGRHAWAKSINFSYDGFPVLHMTQEEELSEELQQVELLIEIKGKN